jgi:hypothetical protein
MPPVSRATQTFCLVAALAAGETAMVAIKEAAAMATTNLFVFFKIPPKD